MKNADSIEETLLREVELNNQTYYQILNVDKMRPS